MKIEIVLNTTYKTHIKNVHIFDHEKNWIEKIAKLLSHSIFKLLKSIWTPTFTGVSTFQTFSLKDTRVYVGVSGECHR